MGGAMLSKSLIQFSVDGKESEVAQSCPTLCDPMDCSPPGSSIHGILQATILEGVAISFSRGSSWPRDRTQVSHIVGRCFNLGANMGGAVLPPCCLTWDQTLMEVMRITATSFNRKFDQRFTERGPTHQNKTHFPPQSLPSGSFYKPLILFHQKADKMKTTVTENWSNWSHGPQPCLTQWN